MASYKQLLVWRKAVDLVVKIYKVTATFPQTESYGLVSQMKRHPCPYRRTLPKATV